MATFALYTLRYSRPRACEAPDARALAAEATLERNWAQRQDKLGELFAREDAITFRMGKKTYPHKLFPCQANPKLIFLRIANVREMLLEQNFRPEKIEYAPSCFVVIDNREGCRRVAIQHVGAAFSTTNQVARVLQHVINERLAPFQLSVELLPQRYPKDFYRMAKSHEGRVHKLRFHVSDFTVLADDDAPLSSTMTMLEELSLDMCAQTTLEFAAAQKKEAIHVNLTNARLRRIVEASAESATPIEIITVDGITHRCFVDTDLESTDKIVTRRLDTEWLTMIDEDIRNENAWDRLILFANEMKCETDDDETSAA